MFDVNEKQVKESMKREEIPDQKFECSEHGEYTGTVLMYLGIEMKPICPECQRISEEKLTIEKMDEEKRREEAAREFLIREQERHYAELNIGEKFWEESFETFNAYTPALKRYLDICIAFSNDPRGRMLLMLGKNGNGKNHLASSILKITGGCMYSVFEIELLLKECYSGKESESELYHRLCKTPMLIINEIGKHKVGEWETNFMSYIINKRYENLMPTVLVTNAHLKENCPQKGCSVCFQNLLGNDVLSRIVETGEIMQFNEKDYRYIKRENRGDKL